MAVTIEIERKYEVDEATVLPGFDGVGEGITVTDVGTVELVADYFDTSGFALAAHTIVLRRRRGGGDEGWHVKRSTPKGTGDRVRLETHWPLTDGHIPDAVLDTLRVYVRDHPLVPIAQIQTTRALLHIIGPDGAELAEIADDRVSARDASTGVVRQWREWEVELLEGAPAGEKQATALLDMLESRVLAAGAVPASSASKLASALGRSSLSEGTQQGRLTRSSPASDVLAPVLARLVDELCEFDPRVRADEHDAVHQMRTRVRRLRSLLASFSDVFDRQETDPVRSELAHLGEVLGHARDAEVMRDRAHDLVDDYEAASVVGEGNVRALRDELTAGWVDDYAAAHTDLLAELAGARYFRLLDRLDELVTHPALTASASVPAKKAVQRALKRDMKRATDAAKLARAATTEPDRIELLHDVRKAAKRLRYAAEAVSGSASAVFGTPVRRVAIAAEGIHDLLGEHRDSSLMQQHLQASAPASPFAFAYGVLFERERHSAALCLADYPAALRALTKLG